MVGIIYFGTLIACLGYWLSRDQLWRKIYLIGLAMCFSLWLFSLGSYTGTCTGFGVMDTPYTRCSYTEWLFSFPQSILLAMTLIFASPFVVLLVYAGYKQLAEKLTKLQRK